MLFSAVVIVGVTAVGMIARPCRRKPKGSWQSDLAGPNPRRMTPFWRGAGRRCGARRLSLAWQIGDARLSGAVRSEEEGLCQSRALATTKPMLGAVQHVLSKQDQTIEPVLDRERELKVLQIGGEVRAEPGDT